METLYRNYKSTQRSIVEFAKMQKIVVSMTSNSYNDTLKMNSYDTISDNTQ